MSASAAAERNDKELAVLNAAIRVFLAHGFGAATTDMIQREAGVSKATMYACFPNKEALFEAVIRRETANMEAAIRAIPVVPDDIGGMLIGIGVSYLKGILSPERAALFRAIVAEAPRLPHLGHLFYRAGPQTITRVVAAQLTEAARRGEIDLHATGAEEAASLFINMARGEGLMEYLTHPESVPSAARMEHWARQAVAVFLAAFGRVQETEDR
ncbi:MAG: TetR/AcrR family transcriptional regulator [Zoogloeaceae bacterium]|jgi:AcrR family transcriptional regulator|nr:TetR/AcrR family transcriptional regulator [Zoogloeaceae bacterium]